MHGRNGVRSEEAMVGRVERTGPDPPEEDIISRISAGPRRARMA